MGNYMGNSWSFVFILNHFRFGYRFRLIRLIRCIYDA